MSTSGNELAPQPSPTAERERVERGREGKGRAVPAGKMRLIGDRISQERINAAKRSFVTRRVDLTEAAFLGRPRVEPQAGDIILARVSHIGHHGRLELVNGRRARLFHGDEIIACYAPRYAPDQFHATLPKSLRSCDLVAAGGIAAEMQDRHRRAKHPTRIKPLGLLIDRAGVPLNVSRAGLSPASATPSADNARQPQVIAVVGSCMNAGKTTTAVHIVKCLARSGLRVAACKATGTGAGGDYWHLIDAGADPVLDFTDAGYASTYQLEPDRVQTILQTLLSHLKQSRPDIIVLEIADGLFQEETEQLIRSEYFKEVVTSIVFAAGDAISSSAGVALLRAWGFSPAAVSGMVSQSPLACMETKKATGLPVLTREAFLHDDSVACVLLRSEGSAVADEDV